MERFTFWGLQSMMHITECIVPRKTCYVFEASNVAVYSSNCIEGVWHGRRGEESVRVYDCTNHDRGFGGFSGTWSWSSAARLVKILPVKMKHHKSASTKQKGVWDAWAVRRIRADKYFYFTMSTYYMREKNENRENPGTMKYDLIFGRAACG